MLVLVIWERFSFRGVAGGRPENQPAPEGTKCGDHASLRLVAVNPPLVQSCGGVGLDDNCDVVFSESRLGALILHFGRDGQEVILVRAEPFVLFDGFLVAAKICRLRLILRWEIFFLTLCWAILLKFCQIVSFV